MFERPKGPDITGSPINCYSPLILDTKHNHKVEAQAGIGVDLNNDGKPDGAAVNGDKMLAMSDLNGNNRIDGAEVFGDLTYDPFTKQPLKASNGFESLRIIAQEAAKRTKTSVITDDNVDIVKLQKALLQHGVQLGYVSDANDRQLEPLNDLISISLNYRLTHQTGIASHQQISTFRDSKGEFPVDDVWF
jgi:hypothetical protein